MDDLERELNEKDQVREISIRICRDIIRLSSSLIAAMNRGERKKNIDQVRELKSKVMQLQTLLAEHRDIGCSGFVEDALQEYVEAMLLRAAVEGKPFPSHIQLKVSAAAYLMGLSDLIGEFRRIVLNLIMKRKLRDAKRWMESMEAIYNAIIGLHYPSSLLNLRKKQDVARSMLDRTMGELTTASAITEGRGRNR